jgi:DNA-binding NarL/FixJ family response regulator
MGGEDSFAINLSQKDDEFYDEFAKVFLKSIDIVKPTFKQLTLTKKVISQAWVKLSIHIDDRLSQREKECLSLFYRGFSLKEIANFLGISLGTVRCHRDEILKKLFSRNLREAIKEGVRYCLLT